ncbi:unnamed protein product [Polarella glacialis]|uniref:Uncharacterized protein n=1 Tax=Polarella glacialis TaxID=89957 RepID=A0A813GNC7_POLGL|nr:unnamed protein product [Polarella glacialis]
MADLAGRLLERAQRLRLEMMSEADLTEPPRPDCKSRLSDRAAAQLELILAGDPLLGGAAAAADEEKSQQLLSRLAAGHGQVYSAGDSERGIHLRLWLGSASFAAGPALSELRAVLKLGPQASHEHELRGFAAEAYTLECPRGPDPPRVFLQLWHGSDLFGLVKVLLDPLEEQEVREILSVRGYVQLFDGTLEVNAVGSDAVVGSLHVSLHAGLSSVLLSLESKLAEESLQLGRQQAPLCADLAAAKLRIAAEEDLGRMLEDFGSTGHEQPATLASVGMIKTSLLRNVSSLSGSEASALIADILKVPRCLDDAEVDPGFIIKRLETMAAEVKNPLDKLVKEVGDEAGTLAMDLLDVSSPAQIQRQDLSRLLRLRSLEVSWSTLEDIFTSLGCTGASEVLPAAPFARLFRRRAEARAQQSARLRRLELEVLSWFRGTLPRGKSCLELVSAYARADGNIDHLGLAVFLRPAVTALGCPAAIQDLDLLAESLVDRLGAPGSRGVSARALAAWLEGEESMSGQKKNFRAGFKARNRTRQRQALQAPGPGPRLLEALEAGALVFLKVVGELLADSIQVSTARLQVISAEEGSSLVCVQIKPGPEHEPSADEAMANLSLQLGDPSSKLGASVLGSYFC